MTAYSDQIHALVSSFSMGWEAVAVISALVALVLLLVGGRLARPLFVLSGGILGGGLGAMIASHLVQAGPSDGVGMIGGIPAPIAGAMLGVFVGLLTALAAYRLALAAGTTALLACAGAAIAVARVGDLPPTDHTIVSAATAYTNSESSTQRASAALEARDALVRWWTAVPASARGMLVIGAAAGGIVGLVIGAGLPRRASALATALPAAAVIVAGAPWALSVFQVQPPWRPEHAGQWALAWLIISAVGVASQWAQRTTPRAESPATA